MIDSTKNKKEAVDYSSKPALSVSTEANETPINLTIPYSCAGMRLDQALAQLLPHWSRSRLQTWIVEARITVNNETSNPKQKVWGDEKIQVIPYLLASETQHEAEDIELDIIFEDEQLIVINKPAGLVVHPGNGNWHGTMLNALLHHAEQLNHVPRAGIVHRLDKDTTGLLVVAKTIETQTSLVRQLQSHSVKREYLALVFGEVQADGDVNAPIGRHSTQRTKMAINQNGKKARTHFKISEEFEGCTLLQCNLETGRTHQIRVHMHSISHPLVGDPVYGGRPKKINPEITQLLMNYPRQALHAQRLALIHPKTQQPIQWENKLPEDMETLLQALRQINLQEDD